jgi:uncharacterized protein YbjT (DUF2867 family)
MKEEKQRSGELAIAVLGGTGHVGVPYITEFLAEGLQVRVLARTPEHVARRFPRAQVVSGSMMNEGDVTRVLSGADAAFLITPIGGNNDTGIELRAARAAVAAARETHLSHLFYASLIQPDQLTGVPLIDVKAQIEDMLAASGLPWSSLRVGFYMEDVLGLCPRLLKRGLFFFPLPTCYQISFTATRDVARVAVELLRRRRVVNGSLDVIEPITRTLADVASAAGEVQGRKVVASGSWPFLSALRLARPLLRRSNPVMFSKVTMLDYFSRHDYVGNPNQLTEVLPGFEVTSMESCLRDLIEFDRKAYSVNHLVCSGTLECEKDDRDE